MRALIAVIGTIIVFSCNSFAGDIIPKAKPKAERDYEAKHTIEVSEVNGLPVFAGSSLTQKDFQENPRKVRFITTSLEAIAQSVCELNGRDKVIGYMSGRVGNQMEGQEAIFFLDNMDEGPDDVIVGTLDAEAARFNYIKCTKSFPKK